MKQRLIDANKAENNLYGFTRYTGIDEAPYEYAETVISKLPTVEAIPIEWLKKCNDKYILCCTIIDDIIEEWKEQNEI